MVKFDSFEEKEYKAYEEKIKKVFPGSDKLALTEDYLKLKGAVQGFAQTYEILTYYGEYDMEVPENDEINMAFEKMFEVIDRYMDDEVFNKLKEEK